ncbi:MAG: hypothetical protein ABI867_33975 [Kofleriaceae bacterium]
MAKPSDIELMQHADGELDERGSAQVRTQIEREADSRTKVESLGQMTELVRGHLEMSADDVPDRRFEAMWREVGHAIDAEAPTGLWARVTSWLDRHRGHLLTGAVSAGAVAAIALMLRPGDPETVVVNTGGGIDVQPAALRLAPVIEDLETPGGNGTVLNIEDDDGHMTVIVVTPADTVEGI